MTFLSMKIKRCKMGANELSEILHYAKIRFLTISLRIKEFR